MRNGDMEGGYVGAPTSLKEKYSVRKTLSEKLEFLNTVFTCVVVVLIKM